MDLFDVAKNFGIPALGALAGFLGSATHYKHKLEQLEKDFGEHKKDHKEKHENEQRDLKEKFGNLQAELAKNYVELHGLVKEIDNAFDRFTRSSAHDFAKDAEFAHFIEEQNKQWQAVHRLLGQIEGILKSQKRWSSQPPPPSPLTRPR